MGVALPAWGSSYPHRGRLTYMGVALPAWWSPYPHRGRLTYMGVALPAWRSLYLHGGRLTCMGVALPTQGSPYLHGGRLTCMEVALPAWGSPYLHGGRLTHTGVALPAWGSPYLGLDTILTAASMAAQATPATGVVYATLSYIIIIMKNFSRRNSHGHHGSKRRDLAQHTHSHGSHAFTHALTTQLQPRCV